jgi:hypothetical protein
LPGDDWAPGPVNRWQVNVRVESVGREPWRADCVEFGNRDLAAYAMTKRLTKMLLIRGQ